MDNQQGPTVEHRGLCSMFVAAWMEGEFWGRMGTCICIAESLYYSPELSHGLLISYSPIQNKKYIYILNITLQPGFVEFFWNQIIIKNIINKTGCRGEKGIWVNSWRALFWCLYIKEIMFEKTDSSELPIILQSPLHFWVFIKRILLYGAVIWVLRTPGLTWSLSTRLALRQWGQVYSHGWPVILNLVLGCGGRGAAAFWGEGFMVSLFCDAQVSE